MATKAYFIGLGGCGVKTVANLQKRLCPNGIKPDTEYAFTYIDTDEGTMTAINERENIIRAQDFKCLGDVNPYRVYESAAGGKDARSERFMEWIIPQNQGTGFTLPNNLLNDGARAQRMIGRTATHFKYNEIEYEIKRKLSTFTPYVQNTTVDQTPKIWVVASSCGGTGSSMTIDVLYILDRLVNTGWQSAPELRLVLFMPQPFIDKNQGNIDYYLNAYSYMWELNAFRLDYENGKEERFSNFCVNPETQSGGQFPLFKYVIPVDVENTNNTKIELDALYPVVAELIYYCNHGQTALTMMSALSNDQTTILGNPTKHQSTPFDWARCLAPYGYRLIKKANEEFIEYMTARSKWEVLRYGLLGEEMPEDMREKAKQAFANEYIVKYLCDLDAIGVSAVDGSLQANISELYEMSFRQENLKSRIASYIEQIDGAENEAKSKATVALRLIKQKIDAGVQKSILDHGLRYTKDLLNIVDDFYLESVVLPALRAELYELRSLKEAKKSECMQYVSTYKDKQAAQVCKALGEYREMSQRYTTLSLAISIVDEELTTYPGGYLEELRKGGDRCIGLQNIISETESAATDAREEYISLAKKFIEKDKDALTHFLPNLRPIAQGENDSYWANDSLFDQLYKESIIASTAGVPERKNEGDNNLCHFVEKVCSGENSVLQLALSDDKLHFETKFTNWVIRPLIQAVSEAINNSKTKASDWIAEPLDKSLEMSNMLPKGLTKRQFLDNIANIDKIPVLFPTSAAATQPIITRVMYAGATQSLAEQLGYVPTNTNSQFVLDNTMTDRFLIIKMPMGYDFFSYKYFADIQKKYQDHYGEVTCGMRGCHLHVDFNTLNLDTAVARAEQRRLLPYVECLYKSVLYQEFLNILEKENKALYNRIWGVVNLPPVGGNPFGSAADTTNPFGSAANTTNPFGSSVANNPFSSTSPTTFVTCNYDTTGLTITANEIGRGQYNLNLGATSSCRIGMSELNSMTNFIKALANSNQTANGGGISINDAIASVNLLKEFINNDNQLRDEFGRLFPKTYQATMDSTLVKFALTWQQSKIPTESLYYGIIGDVLNCRI